MYRITICDDQGDVLDELQQLIMQEFSDMELHCVQDLKEYAKALINQKEPLPDIMIMDIQWEQDASTGIDWAVELQKRFPKLKIIFLTGYIEYAADIFMANPSNFLVKPIQKDKLYAAIYRVMDEIGTKLETVTLKGVGGLQVVQPFDVMYIESNKHEIIVYGTDDTIHAWMKMDEILSEFPTYFIRIHQSYAVNPNWIKKFAPNGILLINDEFLPVSRSRYTKAKEQFLDFLEGK